MTKEIHGGNIYKFNHKVYDFSANLNPLGMPDEVKEAIGNNIDDYESYPDISNDELREGISGYHNIPKECIACGNGAADIIFRIAIGLKPRKALIAIPTFSEYEEALKVVDCHVNHYMLKEENDFTFGRDFFDYITEDTDMIFICNPNNPTGIAVDREFMIQVANKCNQLDVTMVIDECFSDFLEEEERYSLMKDINRFPNVIILKAFTKIFAMAGLRLGYCVSSRISIIQRIGETLQPWAVSTVASKAGCAALKVDGFVDRTKVYVAENRRYLVKGMVDLGFKVFPAEANYIFFKSGTDIKDALEKGNIIIRDCSNYVGLRENFYRIAVRTREENQYFLECLRKITLEGREGALNG